MNVFALRRRLLDDYREYVTSFVRIRDPRIQELVEREIEDGLLWPPARIQLNPAFAPGGTIDELGGRWPYSTRRCRADLPTSARRRSRPERLVSPPAPPATSTRRTRSEAASTGAIYVVTTGTGSGKSLTYLVPIYSDGSCATNPLRRGRRRPSDHRLPDERPIINSQRQASSRSSCRSVCPDNAGPVTATRATRARRTTAGTRDAILARPARRPAHELRDARADPDSPYERRLVAASRGPPVPRPRRAPHLSGAPQGCRRRAARPAGARGERRRPASRCVGTSATLAGGRRTADEQTAADRQCGGADLRHARSRRSCIGETLRRATFELNKRQCKHRPPGSSRGGRARQRLRAAVRGDDFGVLEPEEKSWVTKLRKRNADERASGRGALTSSIATRPSRTSWSSLVRLGGCPTTISVGFSPRS